MSDSFDIGKIDPLKNFNADSTISPQQFTQQAAMARLAEGGSAPAAPAAPASAGHSDAIHMSHEAHEGASVGGAANLLAAWGSQETSAPKAPEASNLIGGFNLQSGPPPGIQGGGVFGPGGITGLAPGMQAGAVYSTPRM